MIRESRTPGGGVAQSAAVPCPHLGPDREQILYHWNATERAYPRRLTMHRLFERHVVANKDAVAVVHRDHAVTYGGLGRRADRWARRLRGMGVGPETLVGIHLRRTPDLVAALLGTLAAGGAYVALDPSYPSERLMYIIEDAGISVLVTDTPELPETAAERIGVLAPDAMNDHQPCPPAFGGQIGGTDVPAAAENLAYVLYTSGSTGHPKGVAITHANAVDLLYWTAETFGADLARVLATTSICFDCSILEIFGPLSWGGTVVLGDSLIETPSHAEGLGVRLLHTVPSVVDDLLRTDRLPRTVRTAIVGGEALQPGLVEKVYGSSSIDRLVNLYGPTEYTSYASMAVIERLTSTAPPIGRPVANTRIYLLDPGGEPVQICDPGEIFIAGSGLARGYLHRPALTSARFVPDPFSRRPGERMYRSGDLGQYDERGEISFLGRVDDQVKVHGVRVEPQEVERTLMKHPGVRDAVVTVTTGHDGRHALVGHVVPSRPGALTHDDLRSFLHGHLPSAFVPSAFFTLERLPKAPNGKTDRRRLTAMPAAACAAPTETASAPIPPATELESVLAELWADAIEVAEIAVTADVFGLGGHSLAALRVSARLSELLGVEVPLRMFFEKPTVAGLAAEIERRFGPRRLPKPAGVAAPWPPPSPEPGVLSPAQRAILARADERPDGPGMLLPLVVQLSGHLNALALAQAVAALTRRHEILGMAVATGRDQPDRFIPWPRTRTGAGRSLSLPLVDLRGVDRTRRLAVARATATALLDRPLNPRAHRPLRVALLRLAEDEHVLAAVLHHIAGDAWSVDALSLELLALYAAAIHGDPARLPVPAQYVDWAAEQQRRLVSPAGRRHHDYWRSLLTDLPVLRLPGDAGRRRPTGETIQEVFTVPASATAHLGEFGRAERATLYMALLAAFATLLHKWSGQTDLPVGCPEAGRIRPELAAVVGPCIDALVLRCDVSGDPSFRTVLRRVRDMAMAAYAHNDVPFIRLVDEFRAEPTRHPLYQASVVLQQWPSLLDPAYRAGLFSRQPIGDLKISRVLDHPLEETALDIELMLFERDDELEAVLHCRGDVVAAENVPLLAADFVEIVQEAARCPDVPLSALIAACTPTPAN